MNRVFEVGRLVADPESKATPSGVSVCEMRIAVPTRFGTETRHTAADRQKSYFFTVIAWRGLADLCAKYLVKGQRIAVIGELQSRSYDAKDGTKRYITEIRADEIEFLDKPRDSETPMEGFTEYTPEDGELPY